MPVKLTVAAESWESKAVKCTFTVQANDVTLVAKDRSKQILRASRRHQEAEDRGDADAEAEQILGDDGGARRREQRHPLARGRVRTVGRRDAGEWRHGGRDPGDGQGEPVQGRYA